VYRPLDDYFIDRDRWQRAKQQLIERAGLEGFVDPRKTLKELDEALYQQYLLSAEIASMIIGSELGIEYDPGQHAAYAASWVRILENQPLQIFRAAADGEKFHTYLQRLQQQQSISKELPADKSEIIKEYDRLVDGPAARRELEKQNPGLVAARDQAIVELRREKLRKETAEKLGGAAVIGALAISPATRPSVLFP
jgi:hypothetical protein